MAVVVVISRTHVVTSLEFHPELVVNDLIVVGFRGLGVSGEVALSVELQSCPSVARGLLLLSYYASNDALVVMHGLDHALCHCSVRGEGSLRLEIGKVGVKRDLRIVIELTLLPLHVFHGLCDVLPQYLDDEAARL